MDGPFQCNYLGPAAKLASKSGFSVKSESGSPCAHTLQMTTDPPPNPSIENFVNAPYEKLIVGLRSSDLCCPKSPIIGMLFSMFPLAITGYMGSVCNMEYRLQRLEIGNLLNNVDVVCTQRLKIHSDRFDLALIFGPGTTGLLYQRKLRRRRRRRKLRAGSVGGGPSNVQPGAQACFPTCRYGQKLTFIGATLINMGTASHQKRSFHERLVKTNCD